VPVAETAGLRDVDDPNRYEQVAEHARGGLGRIVRAVDKRLGRTVAVKELLRRVGTTPADESRFLREALITARLEHPGIVPVHEAGRWPNGDPYYVMKLVEGRTLKEAIAARSTLRERMGLLEHVIAIADAVGYAHKEGVIHRDLKPSNVIVGEFGETIVVDWGLARDCKQDLPEPDADLAIAMGSGVETVSGKVVGTPAYMAPEQARGDEVDERADVYAIGTVLYEMLAGAPPHHDDTPQATLDRVLAGPPRPLPLVVTNVPPELATIVAKAMARLPSERYPNATALAEDLRHFKMGQLVSAHSYTAWSILRKKLSQHRGVVAVAVASAVALGGIGVSSFQRVVVERNNARNERRLAVTARGQAEGRQRELVLLQAVTSLRKDPTATLAWLRELRIDESNASHVLSVLDEAEAAGISRHVFRPGDWVHDAEFTPDGKTIVAVVRDGVVRAYDLETGAMTELGRAESATEMMAVSPRGDFAVTASVLGEVTLWPLPAGEPRVLAHGPRPVTTLDLSADGTQVLFGGEMGALEVVATTGGAVTTLGDAQAFRTVAAKANWSRQVTSITANQIAAVTQGPNGQTLRPLARIDKAISHVAMSPNGETVLVHDGTTVWAVPFAGGELQRLAEFEGKLWDVEWSPDGRTLALAGSDHDVVLVDLATCERRELRGHTDSLYTVQWSRDGRRLLSASDDGTARVFAIGDGTSQVLRGHDDDVVKARFSPDERWVVTSSLDGSIRVWRVDQPGARVLVEGEPVDSMDVQGDRALVKTKGEVAWWNLASGHRVPVFSWATDLRGLGLGLPSPDGELLLVPGADLSLEVRKRAGTPLVLRGHESVINAARWSPDSKMLLTSSYDGTLRRWDLATGAGTLLEQGPTAVRTFAIAKDGRIAIQVGDTAKLVGADGTETILGKGPAWCWNYAEFEPVRDRLVMRRCDGSLAMLEGAAVRELPTSNFVCTRIAVSADGTLIAAAMTDRTVRVWNATDGRLIEVLRGHTDLVMDVAFAPDGKRLASASYDRTVRVWTLGTARHRVLRGHTAPVNRIAWRATNDLVTASNDGTVRIWDLPSSQDPTPTELVRRIADATSTRIDIDRPTTNVLRGT
jgi:WD40 repeat protein